jgi:hypothetical protein
MIPEQVVERCYGVPAELDFIINYDIQVPLGPRHRGRRGMNDLGWTT